MHSKNVSLAGFESGNSLCPVTLTHSQDVNAIKLEESLVNFRDFHLTRNRASRMEQAGPLTPHQPILFYVSSKVAAGKFMCV